MPPKSKDSGRKSQRPRIVVCEAPQTAACPRPQSHVDPMSLASTQAFTPLLFSHTFPPGVPASFQYSAVLPSFQHPGVPSSFQQAGGPNFPFTHTSVPPPSFPFSHTGMPSSFQHTGGSVFSYPIQMTSSFKQTGGSSSTRLTQAGRSPSPHPTQAGQSPRPRPTQAGGSPSPRPTQVGGSHTLHPTHVPAREVDEAVDEIDGADLRGRDDPGEIHVIDGRFWIQPEGSK